MSQHQTIYFDEIPHKYWDDDNTKYTSTTTFLKNIEKPYNSDYWSSYKGVEKVLLVRNQPLWKRLKPMLFESNDDVVRMKRVTNFIQSSTYKYEMLTAKSEFLTMWKKTSRAGMDKGTRIHKFKEEEQFKLLHEQGITNYEYNSLPNPEKKYKKSTPLIELQHGIWYPEVLVCNKGLRISGTIDMLMLTINPTTGTTVIHIDDWKTNKKIDLENRFQTFLAPIKHLDDCEWNKYRLQLSMYAYLAQLELGPNTEFGIMQFTHLVELPKMLNSKEPPKFDKRVFAFRPLIKDIQNIIAVHGHKA